jgi:hypothetical protein
MKSHDSVVTPEETGRCTLGGWNLEQLGFGYNSEKPFYS